MLGLLVAARNKLMSPEKKKKAAAAACSMNCASCGLCGGAVESAENDPAKAAPAAKTDPAKNAPAAKTENTETGKEEGNDK